MSNSGERTTSEKVAILKAICESKDCQLDENTIHIICNTDGPHGFPHTCRLFVTLRKEGVEIDTEQFMKAPLEFLNQTVQKFFEDGTKLLLFKEMLKRDGKISVSDLQSLDTSFGKNVVKNLADSLLDSYLKKEYDCYSFHHPSIYDSVSFILLKHDPLFVIEHCSVSFLHERLRLDPSRDTQHATPSSESNLHERLRLKTSGDTQHATPSSELNLVVYIPRGNLIVLAKRFAKEISMRNIVHVLSHPAVRDEQFVIKVMLYIWLPGYRLPRLTDRNTGDRFLSLIASNKSHLLLKYLDDHRLRKLSKSQLNTVLYGVCKYAASDVLTYLLQSRDTLDINVRYVDDKTPLMIATETRDSQFVQQIMSLGPDLKARDCRDLTVLNYLCSDGHARAVEEVIDRVGDVDVKARYKKSPLWYACWYNQVDVARVLIDRGARFDAQAVVKACSGGNLDLVKLLWQGGATVNMTTHGNTFLKAASCGCHVKVVRFLIAKDASVNTADRESGWSPLHWVCNFNKHQAVQCLLDQGADIYSRTKEGRTPLDIAVATESKQCIDMLQNVIADREITNNRGETVNTK